LIAAFSIKLGILPGIASIYQGMTFGQKLVSVILTAIIPAKGP
jgi:hypothetical protein